MSALPTIRRKAAQVELTERELQTLGTVLFDGMVRLLRDAKHFDITEAKDDEYLLDARMESETIRSIQRKVELARMGIKKEPTQ
jgi:hypothetical protein